MALQEKTLQLFRFYFQCFTSKALFGVAWQFLSCFLFGPQFLSFVIYEGMNNNLLMIKIIYTDVLHYSFRAAYFQCLAQ